jgi:DNA-binding NarL/FixJ family response regulator
VRRQFVPEKLKVAIAEDHYLVREGTRRLLEDSGDVDVVAAVGTATELKDAVRRLSPHAVITDIRMPPGHHMEGIEAAHAIRSEHPEVGVVVLSQHADATYALELLNKGTEGYAYLLKDRVGDLEQLLRALREVTQGGSLIDPRVVEALLAQRKQAAESPLSELTPRELEVLGAMAEGKTNRGIADALFLSESSVEKHVNAIFGKLGLSQEQQIHRRVAAVLAFLRDSGAGRSSMPNA